MSQKLSKKKRRKATSSTSTILTFLLGFIIGFQWNAFIFVHRHLSAADIQNELQSCQQKLVNLKHKIKHINERDEKRDVTSHSSSTNSSSNTGVLKVDAKEFQDTFQMGFPSIHKEELQKEGKDILILPNLQSNSTFDNISLVNMEKITSTCNNIVSIHIKEMYKGTQPDRLPCIALIPSSSGSQHLTRWKRNEDIHTFTRVGMKGRFMKSPNEKVMMQHEQNMLNLLSSLENVQRELRTVLQTLKTEKGVIVLCINKGYIPLFRNFICAAKKIQMDLSSLLIFATDEASHTIAKQLGIVSFYSKTLFDNVPSAHAQHLGDETFALVTLAGAFSVYLVNSIGYNVLFMDADIVLFKNPLQYFHQPFLQKYDVMCMDDGNDNWEYQPYRCNQGFYYIRYNERTRHFLSLYIYNSHLVMSSGIDQIVFSLLINEHVAFHGLNVKTLDWHEFPGGREYRKEKGFIQEIVSGERQPWTLHMHWTANRDDKIRFFQEYIDLLNT